MAFSLETIRQVYAQGRNYVNYGLGVATTLGFVSASQNKGLTDSLNEIYNGAVQIVHGATSFWQIASVIAAPLVTAYLAKKAGNAAQTKNQVASVAASAADPNDVKSNDAKAAILKVTTELPDVHIDGVIKAPAAVAEAVPSAQVVAK